MVRVWQTLIWLVLVCIPALPARADTQLLEVPSLSGPVLDRVGILGSARDAIEQKLTSLKQEKGSEVVVLIVQSTSPETIEQYGIRVVDTWKLGRKGIDDGVLILVAVEDRTVRIEVGRGLEGDIPDVTAFRIIQEQMIPRFKQSDIPAGVIAGVDSVVNRIRGLELPPPVQQNDDGNSSAFFIILFAFVVGVAVASAFGDGIGASAGALLGALITAALFSAVGAVAIGGFIWVIVFFRKVIATALASGSRGRSSGDSWGGGSSSGGSSWGSGGSFSGGGASGRW